jgi:hypothetical protein
MAGITTPIAVTGTLTPESALVKNADGSTIASPVYTDCVYDNALGKWVCRNEAPNGYYNAGAQQFRLKGTSIVAFSQNGVTVNAGTTTPVQLAAPVINTPVSVTSSTATFTWAAISGANGYRVRINGGMLYMPGNVTSYTATGLAAATSVTGEVQALDSTGAKTASAYSAPVQAMTTAASGTGWDGRKMLLYAMGDSRTNGPTRPGWPEGVYDLMNMGAGDGHYDVINGGQNGWTTAQWVNGTNVFMSDKPQKSTYYRSILTLQVGVNNKNVDPNASVEAALADVREIVTKNLGYGFDAIFLLNEAQSPARVADPAWFSQYNAGLQDIKNSIAGVKAVIDMDTLASIQNMQDPTIAEEGALHLTPYANRQFVAPFVVSYLNPYAASQGMPTSDSSSGGGTITPSPPTVSQSGRTINASPSNGLAASLLRFTVKGGAVQTGTSYTVPDTESVDANDVQFYTVASGTYTQSQPAGNQSAIAAVNFSAFYNSSFDEDFAPNKQAGMFRYNVFGEGSPNIVAEKRVVISGGAARFNGQQYESIQQAIKGPGGVPGPAGNYRVVGTLSSKSGSGRWSIRNLVVDAGAAINQSITAPGAFDFPFTTAVAGEEIALTAEDDGVIGVFPDFDVIPA